jgi:hypothetical protein
MTEQEWLAARHYRPLLKFLSPVAPDRKYRLFAVACCRTIIQLIPDETCRTALDVVEQYADDLVPITFARTVRDEVAGIRSRVEERCWREDEVTPELFAVGAVAAALDLRGGYAAATYAPADCLSATKGADDRCAEHQADLLRDIFGNPFRPVAFDPAWRTDTVLSLARQMYDSRDFSPMPILADALQDAGCEDADVLTHCRGPGPHVRGCWVADLVLGKS